MSLRFKYTLSSLAATVALALPCFAALADSASELKARNETAIQRDYGRASGDAYWERRPRTELPAPFLKAFQEAKKVATEAPEIWPPEPQRYGRAGGYIGLDEFHADRHNG
jgi:hypothetical protein